MSSIPNRRISNLNKSATKDSDTPTKRTLSERTLNETVMDNNTSTIINGVTENVDQETKPLSFTLELSERLIAANQDAKDYIASNMDSSGGALEIYGWSRGKNIESSFYDKLFTPDLKVKSVTLRGRGTWDTCRCPKKTSQNGELIDIIKNGTTTNIEHLYIMRTFQISACALLDLIARSPKLKVLRFYGVLTQVDHSEPFECARFLSELEAVYWPWCSRKLHFPTLKTLVKRHDKIEIFYSNGYITCDLLAADSLRNLRHLSLLLNESWQCKPGNTKKATRYLKRITYLSQAKKLESLEIRTYDLDIDEDDETCQEINATVKQLHEQYQLLLWEQIAKLPELKFLSIYGAWELDKVCSKLARHGIRIEYFKTNLMPSNLIALVNAEDNDLILSMDESMKQLRKLAKLRSLHYVCHDNLIGIDKTTVTTLKEVSDLIWTFDFKTRFTEEVEDLVALMLKRANQVGKSYVIKLHIEPADAQYANFYHETVLKHSLNSNLRSRLENIVEMATKERFGRSHYKNFHIWGIQQVSSSRDRATYDQLKAVWDRYEEIYRPIDMFV